MNKGKYQVYRLGLVPYQTAWQLQDRLAAEVARGERWSTLLLLEHPHTYTFGRRGKVEHLLWDQAELDRRGICVHWVDRGGDITYHGPGQLVGYPILSLVREGIVLAQKAGDKAPQVDYVGYLRRLERVLILACQQFGVQGWQLEGLTGIWVERAGDPSSQDGQARFAKLAAIGVKVDAKGVTRHGFALNVAPDMEYWQGIIGCGLEGYAVTSLAEQCTPCPKMEDVMAAVTSAFSQVFGLGLEAVADNSGFRFGPEGSF